MIRQSAKGGDAGEDRISLEISVYAIFNYLNSTVKIPAFHHPLEECCTTSFCAGQQLASGSDRHGKTQPPQSQLHRATLLVQTWSTSTDTQFRVSYHS